MSRSDLDLIVDVLISMLGLYAGVVKLSSDLGLNVETLRSKVENDV
jgi:hypothetical protein